MAMASTRLATNAVEVMRLQKIARPSGMISAALKKYTVFTSST